MQIITKLHFINITNSLHFILKVPINYTHDAMTLTQILFQLLQMGHKMKNLNPSGIYQVGGGYIRLADVEEFLKLNNNSFHGGILHNALSAPVFAEKKFPTPLAVLDY